MSQLVAMQVDGIIKRTKSRCPSCLQTIEATVVSRGGQVVMLKTCPEHGEFDVLLARDARFYYESQGDPGNAQSCSASCSCEQNELPQVTSGSDRFETLSSCVALIEIVDSCNLSCPTCFAGSPVGVGDKFDGITFQEFVDRVGSVIARKGSIDILQLTGGEPTIHPAFFEILEWSLTNPGIGYVLINTNSVRIAKERAFRERLAALHLEHGGFELYVQFDGVQQEGQRELRGADLREVRQLAIDEAGALGVPSTLAMVVTTETLPFVGDAMRFGVERRHVRGVVFQPMFQSGRFPTIESSTLRRSAEHRGSISVGDIIGGLVQQGRGLVSEDDFTPLPCGDPNCHTVGYLLRTDDGPVGLSHLVDLPSMQGFLSDRFNYNLDDLAQCGCENESLGHALKQLEISPDQPFRLFIKPFMDAWTFDEDRIDRCCTHVIRPDGKLDSFCRYYLRGGAVGLGLK